MNAENVPQKYPVWVHFGEISGLQGVWASEKILERCRENLREVLEEWNNL